METRISGDNPWLVKAIQNGCVTVGHGLRNGTLTSEFHVSCDCPPKSLLSAVANALVEASMSALAGRGRAGGADGLESPKSSSSSESISDGDEPILVAQIGECRYSCTSTAATIEMTSGRLLLPGEMVLVARGVPHYSENSQLAPAVPDARPPTFTGPPERDLLASVGRDLDGACLFYADATLQLGGRQPLMSWPALQMSGRQHRVERLARGPTGAMVAASKDDLQSSGVATALALWQDQPPPASAQDEGPRPASTPLRTVLLVGGRCLISGSSILVLSGLLHFAGAWHRVGNPGDGGRGSRVSRAGSMPPLPRISGVSVLSRRRRGSRRRRSAPDDDDDTDDAIAAAGRVGGSKVAAESGAVEDPTSSATPDGAAGGPDVPLLLNNPLLYTQGGTVFLGGTALMTGAVMTMSPGSTPVPLDRQESLIGGLALPVCWNVARLFLQAGRFRVGPGLLMATEGVAWLRAKKVLVGPGPSEQLTVKGALVFPQPVENHDCVWYMNRDLLYKDGLLYLDDLTPVLKGGRVCVGQQEVPLEWLSGIGNGIQNLQSLTSMAGLDQGMSTAPQEAEEEAEPSLLMGADQLAIGETDLLTDGVCLMEANGSVHILRGRLHLGQETVLVDQGVAHFAPISNLPKFDSACFPPPRIVGRALTRPSEARRWANLVDQKLDTATFVDARLSVRRGAVWLNGQVPLLKGCKFVLNKIPLDWKQLMAAGNRQLMQTPGFTGSFSVFANCKSEVTVFSLKARFADGLHFLFGGQ